MCTSCDYPELWMEAMEADATAAEKAATRQREQEALRAQYDRPYNKITRPADTGEIIDYGPTVYAVLSKNATY